jgi:hypothetical protein
VRFVVLSGRLLRTEPGLDAITAHPLTERPELGWDDSPKHLGDLLEQRKLQSHARQCRVYGFAAYRAVSLSGGDALPPRHASDGFTPSERR